MANLTWSSSGSHLLAYNLESGSRKLNLYALESSNKQPTLKLVCIHQFIFNDFCGEILVREVAANCPGYCAEFTGNSNFYIRINDPASVSLGVKTNGDAAVAVLRSLQVPIRKVQEKGWFTKVSNRVQHPFRRHEEIEVWLRVNHIQFLPQNEANFELAKVANKLIEGYHLQRIKDYNQIPAPYYAANRLYLSPDCHRALYLNSKIQNSNSWTYSALLLNLYDAKTTALDIHLESEPLIVMWTEDSRILGISLAHPSDFQLNEGTAIFSTQLFDCQFPERSCIIPGFLCHIRWDCTDNYTICVRARDNPILLQFYQLLVVPGKTGLRKSVMQQLISREIVDFYYCNIISMSYNRFREHYFLMISVLAENILVIPPEWISLKFKLSFTSANCQFEDYLCPVLAHSPNDVKLINLKRNALPFNSSEIVTPLHPNEEIAVCFDTLHSELDPQLVLFELTSTPNVQNANEPRNASSLLELAWRTLYRARGILELAIRQNQVPPLLLRTYLRWNSWTFGPHHEHNIID